jgi:hypothetical protein
MKEYENKRERSKSKPKIIRVQTAKERRPEILKPEVNKSVVEKKQEKPRSKSPSSIIVIKNEEATKANKKLKNINYNKLSNKKTLKSAIKTICLAGEPNRSCREKILEIMDKCVCENYIILFKANYGRFV